MKTETMNRTIEKINIYIDNFLHSDFDHRISSKLVNLLKDTSKHIDTDFLPESTVESHKDTIDLYWRKERLVSKEDVYLKLQMSSQPYIYYNYEGLSGIDINLDNLHLWLDCLFHQKNIKNGFIIKMPYYSKKIVVSSEKLNTELDKFIKSNLGETKFEIQKINYPYSILDLMLNATEEKWLIFTKQF